MNREQLAELEPTLRDAPQAHTGLGRVAFQLTPAKTHRRTMQPVSPKTSKPMPQHADSVCYRRRQSTAPGRAQPDREVKMPETITAFADAEVTDTGAFVRTVNQGVMVAWINADLLNRASHDVRKSIVLYDVDGDFVYAAGSLFTVEGMWAELWAAGVRSWSRGIV